MASVYQTTRGWGVDYRDEWGQRKRVHVGSENAATAYAARIEEQVRQSKAHARRPARGEALSIAEAYDLYLASRVMLPSTRHNEQWALKRLVSHMKALPIEQVTPRLLAGLIEKRLNEASPATVQREVRAIRRLFQFLVRDWYLHADPSSGLDATQIKVPATTALILTREQQQKMLTAATPRTRLRLLLALDAGLRASECHALRANHCNLETRELTVWARKTRNWRTVPMTHRLHQGLAEALTDVRDPDALLFTRGVHAIRRPPSFMPELRLKVGFHFRFHDLRHTFATRLAACTSNPHVVRVLLGHAPRSTTDLYVHPTTEELRAAVDQMERREQTP